MEAIRDSEIKDMIMKDESEKIPEYAQKIAKNLVAEKKDERLSKNQIRNFYTEVKQIEASIKADMGNFEKNKRRFMMLQPRLEYHASKDKNLQKLKTFLMPAIECVKEDNSKFNFFMDFFEAILAYHQVEDEIQKKEDEKRKKENRR